jgi:hypothetical protein
MPAKQRAEPFRSTAGAFVFLDNADEPPGFASTHNICSRNGEPRLMLAARASIKNACFAVIRQRINVAQSHLLSASALRQFNTTSFHGTFKI